MTNANDPAFTGPTDKGFTPGLATMNITVSGVSITLTEEQLKEIDEAVKKQQEPPKPTAEQWLMDFISEPFEVKITEGFITYYRDGQWIFQQDLENKILRCYYFAVWQVFEKEYNLNYDVIRRLQEDVVNKAFNCEGLTPHIRVWLS